MPFNPDEFKDDADFQKYITTQVTAATTGLTTKNEELLGEVKELKGKIKNIPDADNLAKLQEAADKLAKIENENLEKNGEYQKLLDNANKQHTATVEGLNGTIDSLKSTLRKTMVDGELSKALATAKVNPALITAATKLLEADVSFVETDNGFKASVGEKSIADHVAEWASSDVGKNFVLAAGNGGGGNGGDGSGGGGNGDYDKYFDKKSPEYNMTEQAKLYKAKPDVYNQLVEKYK